MAQMAELEEQRQQNTCIYLTLYKFAQARTSPQMINTWKNISYSRYVLDDLKFETLERSYACSSFQQAITTTRATSTPTLFTSL